MTLNDSYHKQTCIKTSFIFITYVMSWLWRCHVSLMRTPSVLYSKKKRFFLELSTESHSEKSLLESCDTSDHIKAAQTVLGDSIAIETFIITGLCGSALGDLVLQVHSEEQVWQHDPCADIVNMQLIMSNWHNQEVDHRNENKLWRNHMLVIMHKMILYLISSRKCKFVALWMFMFVDMSSEDGTASF